MSILNGNEYNAFLGNLIDKAFEAHKNTGFSQREISYNLSRIFRYAPGTLVAYRNNYKKERLKDFLKQKSQKKKPVSKNKIAFQRSIKFVANCKNI